MPRHLLRAILLVGLMLACTTADAASPAHGQPLASTIVLTPAPLVRPSATPSFVPGSAFTGGQIVDISIPFVTVRNAADGDVRVDLTMVRSVWRETEVAPSSLQLGDELEISGFRTTGGFSALDVWANIGVIDATLRSITDGVLELALVRDPAITVRAELSPYIVHAGPWRISDLRAGMTIGAVVYWDRKGLRRITRIW